MVATPVTSDVYVEVGDMYKEMGRPTDADDCYNKAKELTKSIN